MSANILSLNIGGPAEMKWQGKSILSSMLKHPVRGPLVVHLDRVEGNSFASPQVHGSTDAILYAFGLSSAEKFAHQLGLEQYIPGSTGETLTVDRLDESEISVGDIFQIGQVVAQATFPRIPCGKVSYRMQNEHGQQAMIDCGRSGVYFRILEPGLIHLNDKIQRTERTAHPFLISRLYELITKNQRPLPTELEAAKQNSAFISKQLRRWE